MESTSGSDGRSGSSQSLEGWSSSSRKHGHDERVCEKQGVVVGRVGLGDGKVDVDSLLLLRVE